jgi:hypothetical protein
MRHEPGTYRPPSELVERLRRMRWPEASPEARRRSWEHLHRQAESPVAEAHGSRTAAVEADTAAGPALMWEAPTERPHELRPRRHEFAPRNRDGTYSGALGHRVAVARRPTRLAIQSR